VFLPQEVTPASVVTAAAGRKVDLPGGLSGAKARVKVMRRALERVGSAGATAVAEWM